MHHRIQYHYCSTMIRYSIHVSQLKLSACEVLQMAAALHKLDCYFFISFLLLIHAHTVYRPTYTLIA